MLCVAEAVQRRPCMAESDAEESDDDAEKLVSAITIVRVDPKANAIFGHDGMLDAREAPKEVKLPGLELNYHHFLSESGEIERNTERYKRIAERLPLLLQNRDSCWN